MGSVDLDIIGKLINDLVPLNVCQRYKLLPLRLEGSEQSKMRTVQMERLDPMTLTNTRTLVAGMVYPGNLNALKELDLILRHKRIVLNVILITSDFFEELLALYLKKQSATTQEQLALTQKAEVNNPLDVEVDLKTFKTLRTIPELSELAEVEEDSNLDTVVKGATDAPVINLVNKILVRALTQGVSDIHVEPQEEELRIRFRKDGLLSEAIAPLPKNLIPFVTTRFKIIANLDIAERRIPQDGRVRRVFRDRKIDFRVSCIPTRYGEKIVLRILDNSNLQLGLDDLVSDKDCLQLIRDLASHSFGLFLVTGPTGSGKTTTLYSLLAEHNSPTVNICTVEDPIEYSLPGITQVQLRREKDLTFASVLRSFLRQDPDIILVGETRDSETAKTAADAALTGHLVFTTLHTNDAAGAIARLIEMGVEPFLISSFLIGVVAQRLVRCVCLQCRVAYVPSSQEISHFDWKLEAGASIYKASLDDDCSACNGVGYRGRCGVYEVMAVSDRLRELIMRRASTQELKSIAVEEGMNSLLDYSLELVRQGQTTLEEVKRVVL